MQRWGYTAAIAELSVDVTRRAGAYWVREVRFFFLGVGRETGGLSFVGLIRLRMRWERCIYGV